MMKKGILDAIGNTPLINLRRIHVSEKISANVLIKLEFMNPSGSLKDRIYKEMFERAIREGTLTREKEVIEASTGNAGIACTLIGRALGFEVTVIMPEGMSRERGDIIAALGGRVIHTPGSETDVDLSIQKVHQLMSENKGKYWFPNQFENPANPSAHFKTTGPEIWAQTDGSFDAFVASAGSGGTITGIGSFIKNKTGRISIYAAEPVEAPVLSGMRRGNHRIEGIGDGFVPVNLDLSLLDGVIAVSSEDAIAMTRRLHREEGIFCGISTGCNVVAAVKLSMRHPDLKNIVTMANDSGNRYFSTEVFGARKVHEAERVRELDANSAEIVKRHRDHLEIL